MKTDHVVVCLAGAEGAAFRCDHCTLQYTPPFPMPLEQYVEQGKGFALMHRRCPKPEAPSRQMTLPHHAYAVDARVADGIGPPFPDVTYEDEGEMETEDECSARTVHEETAADINCNTYEPAPEVEQAEPDRFAKQYPQARTHDRLRGDLSVVLSNRGKRVPTMDELREWHPDSGIFSAVAYWARVEIAHMNASEYPEIEIPARLVVPEKLEELLAGKPTKKARKPRGKAKK